VGPQADDYAGGLVGLQASRASSEGCTLWTYVVHALAPHTKHTAIPRGITYLFAAVGAAVGPTNLPAWGAVHSAAAMGQTTFRQAAWLPAAGVVALQLSCAQQEAVPWLPLMCLACH
jgi:hypothetical protein